MADRTQNMDERVQLYREITGFTPNIFQQELIEDRVKDVNRWRKAVTWWAGNAYRPQSVIKVIEYYEQSDPFRRPDIPANNDPVWSASEPEPPCSWCGKEFCLLSHEDEWRAQIAASNELAS